MIAAAGCHQDTGQVNSGTGERARRQVAARPQLVRRDGLSLPQFEWALSGLPAQVRAQLTGELAGETEQRTDDRSPSGAGADCDARDHYRRRATIMTLAGSGPLRRAGRRSQCTKLCARRLESAERRSDGDGDGDIGEKWCTRTFRWGAGPIVQCSYVSRLSSSSFFLRFFYFCAIVAETALSSASSWRPRTKTCAAVYECVSTTTPDDFIRSTETDSRCC